MPKRASKSTSLPVSAAGAIRDRIRELRRVPARQLRANPKNWRTHPASQRAVLQGLLQDVGYADALLARELEDGTLELIDGHLRAETTPDMEVPVLVLDVTEAEADKVLATLDPLAGEAGVDQEQLDALLKAVETDNPDVQGLLDQLAGKSAATRRLEEPDVEESYAVLVRCDGESQQKEVLTELDRHGLDVRALCTGFPKVEPVEAPSEPLSVNEKLIVRKTTIKRTPRVMQMEGIFDVPRAKTSEHRWRVSLKLDRPWNIGLIVGPSGSGKTTIARELFGDRIVTGWPWPEDQSLLDGFPERLSINEITGLLSSVGFSSPPSWVKPFHVLSNGEQFRVTLARTLAEAPDLAVVDEFTSVVDRTVAQIGSAALAKTIRATGRRFVAVACHYDIEDWLQPDWKYDTSGNEFQWRSLCRRPEISLQVERVHWSAWPKYADHHYLSGNLNHAAICFEAKVLGRAAAFVGVLYHAHPVLDWWRESRAVCLPDFQGVGIGSRLSDYVASVMAATGKPYRSTSSHPAVIRHRMRSPNWVMVRGVGLMNGKVPGGRGHTSASARMTAGFEWVGPRDYEAAEALGVAGG